MLKPYSKVSKETFGDKTMGFIIFLLLIPIYISWATWSELRHEALREARKKRDNSETGTEPYIKPPIGS